MASGPDEWTERTQAARRWLIDTLFSREPDRAQLALRWARGRYQSS